MKRIILAAFILCVSLIGYAQTNGITYQAVIINPEAQELPGTNQFNTPLANRNICMQFSILDENLEIEYQETVSVNTDEFGMVNLIIGTGNQTGGYANTFQNILWSANAKNLKVDINTNGACANFNEISNQPFTFVPFALFALNSENTALIEDNIIAIADLQTELDTTQAGAGLNADGTYTTNVATNYINTATSIVKATEDLDAQTKTNADGIVANTTTITNNATNTTTAIATVQANVNTLSTATTAGLALKEDTANKSTDVTTDGASDVKFPTVKSVKTYVDAEITAANGTSATALAALQADVNQNEADSDAAETTLQTSINTLGTAITAGLALKENTANKSTNVTTDGASDVKFPTVKSVKTYVDAEITANSGTSATALAALQADVNQNEADSDTADATLQTNINTLNTTVNTNAAAANTAIALKEDAANKSTDVTTDGASDVKFPTVKSVKTYVDAEITATSGTSATALAALQADVNQNEADSDTADTTLQTNINTLTSTVNTNATTAANATALKEDAANKSTDVTTDGASDVKFPTVKSVKTYVDAEITATSGTSATALAALQADVDQNETDSDTAEATLQTNLALKANIASPTFTGTPLAPTATAGTSTTQLATTAFVTNAVSTSGNDFVKLTTNQTIAGTKTFNSNILVNGVTVGGSSSATFVGANALASGSIATAFGKDTKATASETVAIGNSSEASAIKATALGSNTTASGINSAAIGQGATVTTNNTIQLGNTSITNVKTSGTLTAGAITIPNTDGSNGQVLRTNGSGTLAWATPSTTATAYSGVLPVANGGTGSASKNFVDLTTNQTIAGNKTFSNDVKVLSVFQVGGDSNGDYPLKYERINTDNARLSWGFRGKEFRTKVNQNSGNLDKLTYSYYNGTNDVEAMHINYNSRVIIGGIMYPNTDGTNGQVLKTNGSGTLSWITPSVADSSTFVDLTTNQTIAGNKSFSSDGRFNELTIGRGSGNNVSNTVVGRLALTDNTSGSENVAIGRDALYKNTTGNANTVVGTGAVYYATNSSQITAFGKSALHAEQGSGNTAIGHEAAARGAVSATLTNSTFLGRNATASNGTIDNATAIGSGATVNASNTIQLGNTFITNVKTSGTLTANGFVKSGGTATQFLMADGSVSTGAAAVREVADEFTATTSQTSFTLAQTPSVNSKVKMYVNGIRVSNTAYSWSGTTLTYNPSNNGGYSITAGDRIQFDFYY